MLCPHQSYGALGCPVVSCSHVSSWGWHSPSSLYKAPRLCGSHSFHFLAGRRARNNVSASKKRIFNLKMSKIEVLQDSFLYFLPHCRYFRMFKLMNWFFFPRRNHTPRQVQWHCELLSHLILFNSMCYLISLLSLNQKLSYKAILKLE